MINLDSYRDISASFYGQAGEDAHRYFDLINNRLFSGSLERTLITFEIMPYGSCVGLTLMDNGHIKLKYNTEERDNIEFTPDKISTLLHEIIHYYSIREESKFFAERPEYNKATYRQSSHNNLFWISECNRIYKAITGEDLGADIKKIRRNPETGKHERHQLGEVPISLIRSYPSGLITPAEVKHFLDR